MLLSLDAIDRSRGQSATLLGVVRLCGFAFRGTSGPVERGFLPLGELTAVIGANDVGKSRLIRSLAAALSSEQTVGDRAAFFAAFEQDELASLFRAVEGWRPDVRPSFRSDELSPLLYVDGAVVGSVQSAVKALYDESHVRGWTALSEDLGTSRIFAFELVSEASRTVWELYWCLPPERDLRPELLQALVNAREHITRPRVILAAARMLADHWLVQGVDPLAPTPIVRLGEVPQALLPRPVPLPTRDSEITADAASTISALTDHLNWHDERSREISALAASAVPAEDVEELVDALRESLDRKRPPLGRNAWITHLDPLTVRLKPDVVRACERVGAIATSLTSDLISGAYSFVVDLTVASVLGAAAPIEIRLRPIRPDKPEEIGPTFTSDDAADGHRIWIQLALLQAIDDLRDLIAGLEELAIDVLDLADRYVPDLVQQLDAAEEQLQAYQVTVGSDDDPVDPDLEDLRDIVDDAENAIANVLVDIAAAASAYLTAVRAFRDDPTRAITTGVGAPPSSGSLRQPLFLIDEPEQHLHPRVQRNQATWLRGLASNHGAQALVITHAVPFINQADALAYVSRVRPLTRRCRPSTRMS